MASNHLTRTLTKSPKCLSCLQTRHGCEVYSVVCTDVVASVSTDRHKNAEGKVLRGHVGPVCSHTMVGPIKYTEEALLCDML